MASKPKEQENIPAKVKEQPLLPEGMDLSMLEQDSGAGVNTMTQDDVALPFLIILQSQSPQVQPGRAEYIEGAIASMFYNTVNQDFYEGRKEGLLFVPCSYERKYVEWVDRDQGGGYVAEYDIDSDIMSFTKKDDRGKPRMPSGNLIIETAYHSGLYLDPLDETWVQCVFPLKSTGLRVNRRWNNELSTTKIPGSDLQAPRWLYPYRLTTWLETKKNNSWWQLKAERVEKNGVPVPVSKAVYNKAKEFYTMINSGELKRGIEKEAPIDVGSSNEGGNPNEEIPF